MITVSGGPYIKTPRFDYIWRNKSSTVYADNATIELNLANKLNEMNLKDSWVGEYYLLFIARLKSMGMKSLLFGQLFSGAFTTDISIVALVPFLNMTTPVYTALK